MEIPSHIKALSDNETAAHDAWADLKNTCIHMSDENGGWGTDAEYRAMARKRDKAFGTYVEAQKAFRIAFAAWMPELAPEGWADGSCLDAGIRYRKGGV